MTTTQINIEVSISRTTKPYAGEIVGTHSVYGHELAFLPLDRWSAKLHKAIIVKPGQYKLSPGAVVASRRIDTGYIRVSEDGKVTEIAKNEVVL